MRERIKILLVDDHPMLREGLAVIFNAQEDMEVTGGAGNMAEAIALNESKPAQVAVVDYSLKQELGSDVAAKLREQDPRIKVLAISSVASKTTIKAMVKAGATGFVLKDAPVEDLLEAVRVTARGEKYFSREVSSILLEDLFVDRSAPPKQTYACKPEDLTSREIDVLKSIVDENTNKEIAEQLFISVKTVENHRQSLMQKIGARNIAGIVRFALRNNIAG